MTEEVKHYHINTRYTVEFERSAVKGIDGFKVKANGDERDDTFNDAINLYHGAIQQVTFLSTPPKE